MHRKKNLLLQNVFVDGALLLICCRVFVAVSVFWDTIC